MNSHRKFILTGLRQAENVFLIVFLLGCLLLASSWLGIRNETAGKLFGFIVSTLSGPAPIALYYLDISDRSISILWFLSIPVYWFGLGLVVGLLAWKTCRPATESHEGQPPRRKMRSGIAGLSIVIGFFSMFGWPSSVGGGSSIKTAVINNLRQIDAAKSQFAWERKVSPDYVPTEADLTPYIKLKRGGFPHVGPERYILNPIDKPVYAVLDSDWRIRRRGWHEGFTFTNGTVFQLP